MTTDGRYPTFIIAGAMRCGTSALHAYVRAHPEVAVAKTKEVHFFDDNYDLGLDWYASQFPNSHRATAVGEATPNYIYSSSAVERIANVLPGVRLIIMLRNPIDRAYSHYWHDRTRGKRDLPFAEVVRRELDGATDTRYIDRGCYLPQIERVFDLFAREKVLVRTFEELMAQPGALYEDVCRFIGVSTSIKPPILGAKVNSYVEFRSLAVRKLSRTLPSPARRLIGRFNRRGMTEYPPMDDATRGLLRRVYSGTDDRISDLVERRIPQWT